MDLSVCLAPRGEAEVTHILPSSLLPLGINFFATRIRENISQSGSPSAAVPSLWIPLSPAEEGRIAAAGTASPSTSLAGSGTLGVTLGGAEHFEQSRGEEMEEEKEK